MPVAYGSVASLDGGFTMRLRCIACPTLNGPEATVCKQCGSDLRHAEKVYEETVEPPPVVLPEQSDTAPTQGAGSDVEATSAYCACDPITRRGVAATVCFICDLPYKPEPEPTVGPGILQGRGDLTQDPVNAVAVMPEGLATPIAQGLLLGREVPGADRALAAVLSGRFGVSRVHTWIGCIDNQITILDLGSRNGTWVAGQRLQPGSPWHCAAAALPVVVYLGGTFSMTIQRERPP